MSYCLRRGIRNILIADVDKVQPRWHFNSNLSLGEVRFLVPLFNHFRGNVLWKAAIKLHIAWCDLFMGRSIGHKKAFPTTKNQNFTKLSNEDWTLWNIKLMHTAFEMRGSLLLVRIVAHHREAMGDWWLVDRIESAKGTFFCRRLLIGCVLALETRRRSLRWELKSRTRRFLFLFVGWLFC